MSKFFKSAKHTLRALGKTNLEHVRKANDQGATWEKGAEKMLENVQNLYRNLDGYVIQGSKAHKSSKDPNDQQDVITIGFYRGQTRLLSGHLHVDGTYNIMESRAGRGKSKEGEGHRSHNNGESSNHSNTGGGDHGGSSKGKGKMKATTGSNIQYQNGVPYWWDDTHQTWRQVYEDPREGKYYYIDGKGASHWID